MANTNNGGQNKMANFYEVQGQKLLTEWTNWQQCQKTARQAATRIFNRLAFIPHGNEPRTAAAMYDRLPYTSSSACAGVWVCDFEAVDKNDRNKQFDGIMINTDGQAVAKWTILEIGEDVDNVYEVIK